MEIVFLPSALEDLEFWRSSGNSIVLKRIRQLLEAIQQDPFVGIGKPEPLKHNYRGYWSRRIDEEHRLIYQVREDEIRIVKCRYHYD